MGLDLRTTTAAVPLERDVVHVEGPEAVDFLQGQLSQDVAGLPVGTATPALLLHPTGKVVAWLRATRLADDAVALDVDAGAGDAVLARLQRFRLRTKAELELGTRHGWAVRGPELLELPPTARPITWPGVHGYDLLADDETALEGLPVGEPDDLEALRIECGVPATGAELTEDTIPAEAGQWLIDASVSFTKGCYTGQELVARVDSRGGNVPRPLRGLTASAPLTVGALVVLDGKEVGRVTSSAASVGLGAIALAPLSRAVETGAAVDAGGVLARVVTLPMR
jgi:tRNA-modifying protein YgfZ